MIARNKEVVAALAIAAMFLLGLGVATSVPPRPQLVLGGRRGSSEQTHAAYR